MDNSDQQVPQKPAPPLMGEPRELDDSRNGPSPVLGYAGALGIVGLFAWLWVAAGFRSFVIVVGLVIMIFLHEVGHFVTARWTGMRVSQFFLFYGPRIISFTRNGVEYGVRLLPLGAFVRIIGMSNLDECAPEDEPYAYKNATYPRRMLVMTAGSLMHFLQAVILFVVLSSVIGVPKWEVQSISTDFDGPVPATEAGLQPGDTIVEVDGTSTVQFGVLSDYLAARPGEEVSLLVERNGETFSTEAVLAERVVESDGDTKVVGMLGITPLATGEKQRVSPLVGLTNFADVMWDSLLGVVKLPVTLFESIPLIFQGSEEVSVSSEEAQQRPVSLVGIVRIGGDSGQDWTFPISILAFINVFIGLFNLVPLLPLDGGHAAIATYERLRSRKGQRYRADLAKAVPAFYCMLAFLAVTLTSTLWLDIVRPIG